MTAVWAEIPLLVWLLMGAILLLLAVGAIYKLIDALDYRRESREYDRKAYQQLHDRQEFRKIVKRN